MRHEKKEGYCCANRGKTVNLISARAMDQQPWNGHNGYPRSNGAGNIGEQETLDSRVLNEIPHYRLRVQKHAGIRYSSNLFLATQGPPFPSVWRRTPELYFNYRRHREYSKPGRSAE